MKIITSATHPFVKHLVKLRKERSYRLETQRVFVEGKRLISELMVPLHTLIVQEGVTCDVQATETVSVPAHVFEKIAGTRSPEGIAAEVDMPPNADLSTKTWILALDRLNDPGNLGTLLRTALALGFEGALLSPHCVDPYNEKALRAAKGATFKLPLMRGELESFAQNFHLYRADLQGEPVETVSFRTPAILWLGNEAQGPAKKLQKIGTSVTIPITSQMESLNVAIAGGILMHTMKQSHG